LDVPHDFGDSKGQDVKEVSSLAEAYRKAAPYTAASTSLVVAVGGCTWLGHLADGWAGLQTPWLTVAGAVLGMVVGFISFFRQVMGPRRTK
jgi:F0F1-type ATP synthase assembly protein I